VPPLWPRLILLFVACDATVPEPLDKVVVAPVDEAPEPNLPIWPSCDCSSATLIVEEPCSDVDVGALRRDDIVSLRVQPGQPWMGWRCDRELSFMNRFGGSWRQVPEGAIEVCGTNLGVVYQAGEDAHSIEVCGWVLPAAGSESQPD
jgi:hypothetical protein